MSSSLSGVNPYFRSSGPGGGESGFADPWSDMATAQMPLTIRSALWWSEYIWTVAGTYRTAMQRIASYFITDIELSGDVSEDEKLKYKTFLDSKLNLLSFVQLAADDRLAYGNAFLSVLVPFRRFLMCPKTGNLYPLRVVHSNPLFKFEFSSNFEFVATCPVTGWRGPWSVQDKPVEEAKHVILKRWNVHEIELLHDPFTDEVAYLWRIPEDYKQLVRAGNLFHLERASKQVLEAIKSDKMFRFNDGVIFHMKEPTLAGIRNRGWGMPRSLTNFRQIWYVQVLRRYNEAIAMDYVIPFRILTPAPRSGSAATGGVPAQDPISIYNGGDLRAQIRSMINRRRRDPAGIQSLPFPVQYQMLGGEANQLAPTELIEQGYDTLLNEAGVPVEFYKGSLGIQVAPVALRLFESMHRQLVAELNSVVQWACDAISEIMSWEQVTAKLKRVTVADDLQKQMAALQLMMGQQLSGTSGLAAIGFDWRTEQKRLAEEARDQQEMQARQQEEMEQAGFAAEVAKGSVGGAPAGGQPQQGGAAPQQGGAAQPQGGNAQGPDAQSAMGAGQYPVSAYIQTMGANTPITPNDLQAAAEQLANELLGLPEGVKDSELRKLKQFNPTLHSLVRTKMDEKRNSLKSQGGAMLQQQMFGGGGGAMPAG
jgi:hypothetical protein